MYASFFFHDFHNLKMSYFLMHNFNICNLRSDKCETYLLHRHIRTSASRCTHAVNRVTLCDTIKFDVSHAINVRAYQFIMQIIRARS